MAWYDNLLTRRKKEKKIKLQARSYKGAGKGRLFSDFLGFSASADQELRNSLVTLRNRSRELARNDAYVKRYFHLLSTNVIGHNGIRVSCKSRDANGSLDVEANKIIEDAWKAWGKKGMCTIDAQMSFLDCQKMFIEALARDGEVIIRKIKTNSNPYGFTLQFLEADHLIDTKNELSKSNGNRIVMGVELDDRNKVVAYHLYKNHPHEYGYTSKVETIRVPANEIIHAFIKERPEQTRGVPFVAPVMANLKMLSGYLEAEIVAARVGASKMGFFISPDGDSYQGEDFEDTYNPIMSAEAGTFEQLPVGMDFKSFDPTHPSTAFPAFTTQVLRSVASGLNISYHSLSNDLSSVNYSSIRAGTLEDRAQFQMLQKFTVQHFIEPIYREWLSQAISNNVLPLPINKFDKFADSATFIPRSWGWVDPQKEMMANVNGLSSGIVTYQDIQANYGRDVEELFEQHDREQKLAEQYGIQTAYQPFGAKLPIEPNIQGSNDGET
tara:strand:+ start:4943 stop:6430 length:1488 start_codon:yes stop_codon:yes gene_type:complete